MSEQTNVSLNATARAMRKLAHRQQYAGDGLRHENRRRIVVRSIPEQQVLPGGYLATKQGEELIVYESDVPKIQALIEDERLIDEAKKWVEDSKAAHAREKGVPFEDCASSYTGPITWSQAFRMRNLRPCKPLISVEVDDEVLDPPQSEDELKSMAQTEAIVRAVMLAMQEQTNNRPASSDKGRRGK